MSDSELELEEEEVREYRGMDPNRITNFSTKLTPDNITNYRLPAYFNPPNDVIGASNNGGWWKVRFVDFPICTACPLYMKKMSEKKKVLAGQRFTMSYEMDEEEIWMDLTVADFNRMVKGSKSRFGNTKTGRCL